MASLFGASASTSVYCGIISKTPIKKDNKSKFAPKSVCLNVPSLISTGLLEGAFVKYMKDNLELKETLTAFGICCGCSLCNLKQLSQRNASQGFRYMQKTSNGVDPSLMPQGLMGSMMPLLLDSSSMQVPPVDAVRIPIPISALTFVLVSAPHYQQHLVGDRPTTVMLLEGEFLKEAKPFIEDGVHPQNLIQS